MRPLTAIETRVLGTLMEKDRTVPDSYPLTLNSVVAGCNQKSSRDTLMNVSDAQAQEALDALRQLSLVVESSGSRVARWEHNFQRAVGVPEQSAVLLGVLMLRGPQTAGELRINTERWYRFADISSVEGFLDELAERAPEKGGPLVIRLPRASGAREQRWAHLLAGPPALALDAAPPAAPADEHDVRRRIAAVEAELAHMRELMAQIRAQLGMSQPGQEK